MTIRALIFDFDGLMVDTESVALASWQEIFAEHGARMPFDHWASLLGGSTAAFDPCAALETQIGFSVDRDAIWARRRVRKHTLGHEQPLLPGVRDYVNRARELSLDLAVASSSDRAWVAGHLDRLDLLDRFDHVVTSDDVERVKPAPDLYLKALSKLGVAPDEAFALEDSANGTRAAQAAGLFCVVVPNAVTERLPLDHADLRLASLTDLSLDALISLIEERTARTRGPFTR